LVYAFACKARHLTFYVGYRMDCLLPSRRTSGAIRRPARSAKCFLVEDTGQVRIVIWRNTAETGNEGSNSGARADMHHELGPIIEKTLRRENIRFNVDTFSQRLFANLVRARPFRRSTVDAAGLAILWCIRNLPVQAQPFVYAMFALSMTELSASFACGKCAYRMLGLAAVLAF